MNDDDQVNKMSHQAQLSCGIKNANPTTHREAIELMLQAFPGAHIVENTATLNGYRGQKWSASGIVVRGLPFASYSTDVDFSIDQKGTPRVNGDGVGLEKAKLEYEKAYKAVGYKKEAQAKGLRTKLTNTVKNHRASYALEGIS